MRRISWKQRIFLYIVNLLAIGFLVLPLVPVILGSLQAEKTVQEDIYASAASRNTPMRITA